MTSSDRTIVITGGTSGLGYECARNLARDPHNTVVITGREANRTRETAATIGAHGMALDLSSRRSVGAFVAELVAADLPPLAGLVCNAGVQFTRRALTADGMEATFATNHLGHLGLILDLLDHFTAPARIILVSSGTHDPDQLTGMPHPLRATARELAYPPPPTESAQRDARRCYTTSKLANLQTSYHLARELAPRDITVNAFDPGLMPGTGLARDASAVQRIGWKTIARALVVLPGVRTPRGSGADLAWFVAAPERAQITGEYLVGRKPVRSSVASYDEQAQQALYRDSLELLAELDARADH
ncbi:SDR family NAD(P)-dependent oxidoreductase [Nocardia alba]|uniref:NAD(P)-dependent dehydrogenase (Short-subunit alcohol dehydrogenase family) n=1 Tax=Nocardia alba TaxID=225051 RepID=A0A4R1FJJ8_9NOCA|nr:SDR family NAD(P)-dependent oxidoreductase [Nocardia alba]TCJ93434.1 NAD(P)-dependent dehydrogenase (short-subunit alcohol dehydrogenase family) [Nocardia alba]